MKIMNNMEKMKIRLHQLSPVVGDLDNNKDLILEALRSAESDGVELLVLPEMCLTAYPAMDLLESERFRERCYELNRQIAEATGETALRSEERRVGRESSIGWSTSHVCKIIRAVN